MKYIPNIEFEITEYWKYYGYENNVLFMQHGGFASLITFKLQTI